MCGIEHQQVGLLMLSEHQQVGLLMLSV